MTSKILSAAIGAGTIAGNSTNLTVSSNGSVQLAANNITEIYAAANGNVGIGNSTPANILSVNGNTFIGGNIVTGYPGSPGYVSNKSTAGQFDVGLLGGDADASGYLYNRNTGGNIIFGSNNVQRMAISSAGDVNIGGATATPPNNLRYLDLYNTETTNVNSGSIMRIITANSTGGAAVSVDLVKYRYGAFNINNNDANGTINFGTTGTNRMTIDSTGNLLFNSGYGSAQNAYGCRAWVNYQAQATVAIRASQGVTSITKNGTGDYTVNLSFTMPDINYSYVVAISSYVGGTTLGATPMLNTTIGDAEQAPTTTTFRFATCVWNAGSSGQDAKYLNIIVVR